jgi:serine/threonine protein phosphatase PrpC
MQILQRIEDAGSSLTNSRRLSEDAYCYGRNYVAVFDGATPLSQKAPYMGIPGITSDAHWIANKASEVFPDCLDVSLDTILPKLQKTLSEIFKEKTGIDPETLAPTECPSTTVSFAIERDNHIHFFQLGDSPIFIRKKDNSVIAMEGDPVLLENDKIAIATLQRKRSYNRMSGLLDLNAMRKGQIPNIRHLMNKAGGYGVLTIQKPEVDHIRHMALPKEDVKDFILMSDGMMDALDVFGLARSHKELYGIMTNDKYGLAVTLDALRCMQRDDPEGHDYPRIKIGDDVVALHVRP